MSKYPSQMQDKFNLRFPDGMRDAIAERAKRNGRSMNAEIVQIIEDAIAAEATGFPAGDARELRRVIKMQDESIESYQGMVQKMAELVQKVSSMAIEEINKKDNDKKPI